MKCNFSHSALVLLSAVLTMSYPKSLVGEEVKLLCQQKENEESYPLYSHCLKGKFMCCKGKGKTESDEETQLTQVGNIYHI